MDHFLSQLIAKVEEDRLLVEYECSVLSKLLKPWPLQRRPSATEKEKTITEDTSGDANSNESKQERELPPADRLALEQVNQLLDKARWTRESKTKKPRSHDNAVTDSQPSTTGGTVNVEKLPTEVGRIKIENKDTGEDSKIVTVVMDREKSSLKGKKPTRESHPTRSNVSKKVHTSSVPGTQAVRKSMSRPSSATSSRSSTARRNDFVPAHINAPFKTDINTRVPNRKFNFLKKNQVSKKLGESVSQKNQASRKFGESVSVLKKNQPLPLEASAFKTLPKINAQQAKARDSMKSAETENVADQRVPSVSPHPDGDSAKITPEAANETFDEFAALETEPSHRVLNQQKPTQEEEESYLEAHEEKCMSLRDNSLDLKIPPKLRRLYSMNQTLLAECHDTKIRKKVLNSDPAQSFVERLKSQTEVCEELWIRERALTCLKAHKLMHQLLESLQLADISEQSPYEEMYRTKKKLEFVLFMFGKLQDEADYFSQVQFKTPLPLASDVKDQSSPIALLERLIRKGTHHQQCCHSLEKRMTHMQLEHSRRWTHLKFMEVYYQIHRHLLALAEQEWWPIASSDSSDSSILQLAHSLMTSCGEHFPSMIDNRSS